MSKRRHQVAAGERPHLANTPKTRELHARIVEEITNLGRRSHHSPLATEFKSAYDNILKLFSRFQDEVIESSSATVTCGRGCAACCFHWVEDVCSFEAEIMAEYVREQFPERIEGIIETCESDERELRRLDLVVEQKLRENKEQMRREGESIDQVDLLLAGYYQLRRPCPLLGEDGQCTVYPVRPMTCRCYVSFSDPSSCDPGYINDHVPTCLIELEEEAGELMDTLHFMYDRFDGDTGLRSLLAKCLRNPLC